MIRPEAAEAINRWKETLTGAGIAALGAYWGFFTGGGILHYIGYLLIAVGALLGFAGIQRARFRMGRDGPGVVNVIEKRITYFGPLSGGVIDLDDITTLTLDPTSEPPHWLLAQPGQLPLAIPLTAEGADTLFDAFASLPGIRTEHMLRQMQSTPDHPVVIWRRQDVRNTAPRLH
ncbi:hypothetical protein [Tropicibacter naphthalenivorans]|uniref:Uncharacterized protein n=1 Tax=Tropicibacter naphthalenivorans TaxID=441103 RepID=A0A0P1GJ31_9RHOB|nr:hypothetical protein [Tropicibacter naphthalenivorans]CUH75518.1 hypothetical protein TRN7648_00481 [Tropicibacter naphthalenivorans]SMC43968.1 hypothetical protein SAMN04488093_101398 [Tropicibacter naphthalenivorans]